MSTNLILTGALLESTNFKEGCMYWVTLLVPNLSYRRGLVSLRSVFPIIEISCGVVLILRFICFGINTIFDLKI